MDNTCHTKFTKITEGQLFFNSTTNTFKETITDLPGATWSSGGNLNTARGNNPSSTGGTQTAAMFSRWRLSNIYCKY